MVANKDVRCEYYGLLLCFCIEVFQYPAEFVAPQLSCCLQDAGCIGDDAGLCSDGLGSAENAFDKLEFWNVLQAFSFDFYEYLHAGPVFEKRDKFAEGAEPGVCIVVAKALWLANGELLQCFYRQRSNCARLSCDSKQVGVVENDGYAISAGLNVEFDGLCACLKCGLDACE